DGRPWYVPQLRQRVGERVQHALPALQTLLPRGGRPYAVPRPLAEGDRREGGVPRPAGAPGRRDGDLRRRREGGLPEAVQRNRDHAGGGDEPRAGVRGEVAAPGSVGVGAREKPGDPRRRLEAGGEG